MTILALANRTMSKRTVDGLPAGLKVDAIVTPAGLVSASNTSRPAEDEIQVQMLGSGQEVGRSCCLIKYRGRTIVCDAGSHPGLPGMSALPYLDEVDWSTVDAILITQYATEVFESCKSLTVIYLQLPRRPCSLTALHHGKGEMAARSPGYIFVVTNIDVRDFAMQTDQFQRRRRKGLYDSCHESYLQLSDARLCQD